MKIFVLFCWVFLSCQTKAQELKLGDMENLPWGQLDIAPNFLTEKGFELIHFTEFDGKTTYVFNHPLSGNSLTVESGEEAFGSSYLYIKYGIKELKYFSAFVKTLDNSIYKYVKKEKYYLLTTSSYSYISIRVKEDLSKQLLHTIEYYDYQGKELSSPNPEKPAKNHE